VGRLGVTAGLAGQAGDGALVDLEQPAGLADAAAVLEVLQHGQRLVGAEVAVEQRGALALGEAPLAALAVQQAARLARPVEAAGGDVATAAFAVPGAVGVEAAEAGEVFHEHNHPGDTGRA
jgi:hypothetical protein